MALRVPGIRSSPVTWLRGAPASGSVARRLAAISELAPSDPPFLVSSGLQLASALARRAEHRGRAVEPCSWERLLALRQGPGADGFVVWPVPQPSLEAEDLLLERAVEIRALVDSLREHRVRHEGQPLDRFLRKDILRIRRVPLDGEAIPVVVRLGSWYVIVPVRDEHPRQLRRRIELAFERGPRELGHLRLRRLCAPLVVSLLPVSLAEAVHLHRWGLEGPWLSWSYAGAFSQLGVLAGHHLVLEGPGFACLRVDFRRRLRAMRLALGLDATDTEWDGREDFGPVDASPFALHALAGEPELDPLWLPSPDELFEEFSEGTGGPAPGHSHGSHRLTGAPDPDPAAGLPPALARLAADGHWSWLHPGRWTGRGLAAPSMRYATVERGRFSLSATCYSYCCAQHQALQAFDPSYGGQGFTFVVPFIRGRDAFAGPARRRARPVLCSLRTRRGLPESYESFARRLGRRLEEAERGDDLLSQVLGDMFRMALPDVIKALAVQLVERAPGAGGTFLGGRGLVAYTTVPDEAVDPVANYAGIYEGLFSGSCQERGGVGLSIIDRGYRRDLCAVGTGVFRGEPAMDLFWQAFAERFSRQTG